MKLFCFCSIVLFLALAVEGSEDKVKKALPIFQVVKFPNDACTNGGTKNGTCYTAEECSNRGGTNDGTCAEGYGVCCTFTLGCGASTSENCTYFEASSLANGACAAEICKCNSNVCQIRLDFNSFVISGPSTSTTSVGAIVMGTQQAVPPAANGVSESGQCNTDTFSITNQNTVPRICGTNTGEHVYFEASEDCNHLSFQFGTAAIGISAIASRSFSIKVTQIGCDSELLAPEGCTQYYYGSGASHVRTFNYNSGNGRHLADQDQLICVRRESGNCAICWSADAATDVQLSGMAAAMGDVEDNVCCGYGVAGVRAATKAYDCLMIPGATKAALDGPLPVSQCGHDVGLQTKAASAAATAMGGIQTVCSRSYPFRIRFMSDRWEYAAAAIDEGGLTGTVAQDGFKLQYWQTTC